MVADPPPRGQMRKIDRYSREKKRNYQYIYRAYIVFSSYTYKEKMAYATLVKEGGMLRNLGMVKK